MRRILGAVGACACLVFASNGLAADDVVLGKVDQARMWAGQTFVDVIDATDKAFGEARIEDREQIVRAKVGIEAEVRQHMDTEWSVPSNFRIPLPGIERRFNMFIDISAATDTSNLSDVNAATSEKDSTISATILRKLSEDFDLGATLGVHGGPDIGPEVFVRYDRKWLPWGLFAEQRGYWRTDNGWGGRTIGNVDYLLSNSSYIRWANKADYFQELHDVNWKTGLIYRWLSARNLALSGETGVEYNPYHGDPESDTDTSGNDDDDQAYVRLRVIGKVWREWIEWEVMPGYYYFWEHDNPKSWGINARLSIMYESLLNGTNKK